MAWEFGELEARIHFSDDSEQTATVKIPHAPVDADELADLVGGDLTAFVPDIQALATEYDDATDAAVEKITFHLSLVDVSKDSDLLQGSYNTVEDKAFIGFQTTDGRTWTTTCPAPDQSFIAGDIVDESDADWQSIATNLIATVVLKGASAAGVLLAEYLFGYRVRGKTRMRKAGVTQAHSQAGV